MVISELFAVVTVITLVWPGALNALFGQSYSPGQTCGVSRVFFESVTLGSLAVMIVLGLVFWRLGERKRRAGLLGIAIPAEGPTAGSPGSSGAEHGE